MNEGPSTHPSLDTVTETRKDARRFIECLEEFQNAEKKVAYAQRSIPNVMPHMRTPAHENLGRAEAAAEVAARQLKTALQNFLDVPFNALGL